MNYYLYELINKEDIVKPLVEMKNRWMDNKKWKKLYSDFTQLVINTSRKELDILLSKKYLQIPYFSLNSYEKQVVLIDFRAISIKNLEVKDVDLTYVCFDNSDFSDSQFLGTDFSYSSFDNCVFKNCKFVNVKFSPASFKGTKFINCQLDNVDFEGSMINDNIFIDSNTI
jgi:uncharacterized protein YjbI with pentapeptide repeats